MNANNVIARMDAVLLPLGFHRKKATWNRSVGTFVDAIEIQVNKAGGLVTINAGVLDPEVYRVCWNAPPPAAVEVPSCTVNARVGQLVDLNDRWWPLDAEGTPGEVAESLRRYVVPFLERMHTDAAMEQFLLDSQVTKQRYPLPIIHLAVLTHRSGDKVGACRILADLVQRAIGAWRDRAAEIGRHLGCESTE